MSYDTKLEEKIDAASRRRKDMQPADTAEHLLFSSMGLLKPPAMPVRHDLRLSEHHTIVPPRASFTSPHE